MFSSVRAIVLAIGLLIACQQSPATAQDGVIKVVPLTADIVDRWLKLTQSIFDALIRTKGELSDADAAAVEAKACKAVKFEPIDYCREIQDYMNFLLIGARQNDFVDPIKVLREDIAALKLDLKKSNDEKKEELEETEAALARAPAAIPPEHIKLLSAVHGRYRKMVELLAAAGGKK